MDSEPGYKLSKKSGSPALARQLLHEASKSIDTAAQSGAVPVFQARLLLEVALLQGDADVERRARGHLRQPFDPFAFSLTSLRLTTRRSAPLAQPTPDDAEREFPLMTTDDCLAGIRRTCRDAPHILYVLDGRLDEALALPTASLPLGQSEIAGTVALMGDLARARNLTEAIDDPSYREAPLVAIAVEAFRLGEDEMLQDALDALGNGDTRSPWISMQLALGLMGREPWAGYPYPDY